jgi:hypothetical protein
MITAYKWVKRLPFNGPRVSAYAVVEPDGTMSYSMNNLFTVEERILLVIRQSKKPKGKPFQYAPGATTHFPPTAPGLAFRTVSAAESFWRHTLRYAGWNYFELWEADVEPVTVEELERRRAWLINAPPGTVMCDSIRLRGLIRGAES